MQIKEQNIKEACDISRLVIDSFLGGTSSHNHQTNSLSLTMTTWSSSVNPSIPAKSSYDEGGNDVVLLIPLLRDDTVTADSPIQQVSLTVPATDDPSLPSLTFRSLLLGLLSCLLLSFLNQFFWFRRQPLSISSVAAQVVVLPLGRLLSSGIISRKVFLRGTRWEFTLNPGRFNIKEHVLVSIFASCGTGSVYAVHVVAAIKVFYKREMSVWVGLVIVLTSQVRNLGSLRCLNCKSWL